MNFRDLPPQERRALAQKGGKAATGRHKWTSEEAREAGRKSGRGKTKADLAALGKKGGSAPRTRKTKKERGTS